MSKLEEDADNVLNYMASNGLVVSYGEFGDMYEYRNKSWKGY